MTGRDAGSDRRAAMDRRTFAGGSLAAVLAGALASGRGAAAQATPVAGHQDDGFQVVFVRHAESELDLLRTIDVPAPDLPPDTGATFPLTQTGVEQAIALAAALEAEPVRSIVSSVRLRAIQTADALAFSHGIAVKLAPELVEVAFAPPDARVGKQYYLDAVAVVGSWLAGDPDARAPGGESLNDVWARVVPAVEAAIERDRAMPGTLVFVSHSYTLAAALPAIFANVSLAWAMTHGVPSAGMVRGAFVDGRLVCTDWAGETPT